MEPQKGYLIIDIGTGNVRVAITDQLGSVLHLERDNLHYKKDALYPDALSFDPNQLWAQVVVMIRKAVQILPGLSIEAISASSQREGVVLLDAAGESLIGLSNHDHRGREWEDDLADKQYVYARTGRYPTSLFSAFKLIGIKHRRPDIYRQFSTMLSISDWAQYQLSGVQNYEHSQASETLLYDVEKKEWSETLCGMFGIDSKVLPQLRSSGTVLGNILPGYAATLNINPRAVVVVGGADTQLAIKSTRPSVGDIIIVSGTTTPIVKIVSEFIVDDQERTWTNRHIDATNFILEANAGVTGLNYQRLKEIFYPNETYAVIEQELAEHPTSRCVASLGSLVAEEKTAVTKGGFIFNTPVPYDLSRASFVRATLWDIACAIKANFKILCSVTGSSPDFVWACGGGFQSKLLRQFIANLTGKKVFIRAGYEQASVVGAALVCSEALNIQAAQHMDVEECLPTPSKMEDELYEEWKLVRKGFRERITKDNS